MATEKFFQVRYSEGRVEGTRYSENWSSEFLGTEESAREFLERESHALYIGGTSRTVTLFGEEEGGEWTKVHTLEGCQCHTPSGEVAAVTTT